jgi:hypothetical protein
VKIPDIDIESAHLGNWIDPDDVEALIPVLSERYYQKYKTEFFGDEQDLMQAASLALWQYRNGRDRVRELEAFAVLHSAIQTEIQATQRSGVGMHSSQDPQIDWKLLTVPDHQLIDAQAEILGRFRTACYRTIGNKRWVCCYLLWGCGWEPEQVTWYFRRRKNAHGQKECRVLPEEVLKLAESGRRRLLKKLNPVLIEELNTLSLVWWGTGRETYWSVGRPEGR